MRTIIIRQVVTEYDYKDELERAACPFCGEEVLAEYTALGLLPLDVTGCRHYEGLVSAGGTAVAAQFRGLSDEQPTPRA